MRIPISTKPLLLKGFAYITCISQLGLSYGPLRNDPKFLVTYKTKDLFLAQAAAHFISSVDLHRKISPCLANSGLMAEGGKSECNHMMTPKIPDGKVVDISFCLRFSGSLVRADHLTTPEFSRAGMYNPSTGKIHVATQWAWEVYYFHRLPHSHVVLGKKVKTRFLTLGASPSDA